MKKPEKIGEEKIVYHGRIIEVVEQDVKIGDKDFTFEKARRSPGVRLIAVTPRKKLIITREYRSEIEDYDYRLAGGKVFDSLEEFNTVLQNGADITKYAKEAAVREAIEEIAIEPTEINLVSISKSGATIEWDLYYFVVTQYKKLDSQQLEDGEVIEVIEMPMDEVRDFCLQGEFKEDRSVAQLLRFLHDKI